MLDVHAGRVSTYLIYTLKVSQLHVAKSAKLAEISLPDQARTYKLNEWRGKLIGELNVPECIVIRVTLKHWFVKSLLLPLKAKV